MNAEQTIEDIDDFEKKLKVEAGSSSDEEQENDFHSTFTTLFTKLEILEEQIAEKDEEIAYYNETLRREEMSADYTDQKIAHLTKQNKVLQSSLEVERNRALGLMQQINDLRGQTKKQSTSTIGWKQNRLPKSEENFRQKYHFFEKQYQGLKFKLSQAKVDLKKAKRLVQREIGEVPSNWKGRHQLIIINQKKIQELRQQVSEKAKVRNTFHVKEELGTAQQRRQEIEQLQNEEFRLKEAIEKFKKQTQGASSRKIAIEKEVKEIQHTHKTYLDTLIQKTDNDNVLINELKEELDRVKKTKGVFKTNLHEIAKLNRNIEDMQEYIVSLKEELQEKNMIVQMFQQCPGDDGNPIPNEIEYKKRIKQLELEVEAASASRPKRSENSSTIKELSAMNARYRAKVNQLLEEIEKYKQ